MANKKFGDMTQITIPPDGGLLLIHDGSGVKSVSLENIKDYLAWQKAGSHNSFFRGRNLGSAVSADQYDQIDAGTFDDLYIGDFWEINSVKWRIAAFDYWLHKGDTECTKHHVVIVPDSCLVNASMNNSNVTTGAYVGSDYYTGNNSNTGKATAKGKIEGAFGAAHLLSHREYLKNAVTNGYESGGSWYDSTFELMTEQMLYGCRQFGNVMCGTNVPSIYTIDNSQLPLFALAPEFICNRENQWLRDVVSTSSFAHCYDSGLCNYYYASSSRGVRPAFGIVKS